MALINCPECDKQVSDKAEKCLNCGVGIAVQIKQEPDKIPFKSTSLNRLSLSDYEEAKKSPTTALILCLLFGPLGTFYVGLGLGFIMCVIYLISLSLGFAGYFLMTVVNMIICYIQCNEHNEKLKISLLEKQNNPNKPEPIIDDSSNYY